MKENVWNVCLHVYTLTAITCPGLFVNKLHHIYTICHYAADKTLATLTFIGCIRLIHDELQYYPKGLLRYGLNYMICL